MPQFVAAARRLIEDMPEPWSTTLIRLGQQGAFEDPEYEAAVMEFYRRHLCRLDPWPKCVLDSMSQLPNQIYLTMNGPTEFDVIGSLASWDRTSDLGRIRVPTLVTVGGHDEIPESCSRTIVDGVPDARLVVFGESGHMAHEEEPERYAAEVEAFLREAEQASGDR
jgi:proline-specific peptidase